MDMVNGGDAGVRKDQDHVSIRFCGPLAKRTLTVTRLIEDSLDDQV